MADTRVSDSPTPEHLTVKHWQDKKKPELVEQCVILKIARSGSKPQLAQRIVNHLKDHPEDVGTNITRDESEEDGGEQALGTPIPMLRVLTGGAGVCSTTMSILDLLGFPTTRRYSEAKIGPAAFEEYLKKALALAEQLVLPLVDAKEAISTLREDLGSNFQRLQDVIDNQYKDITVDVYQDCAILFESFSIKVNVLSDAEAESVYDLPGAAAGNLSQESAAALAVSSQQSNTFPPARRPTRLAEEVAVIRNAIQDFLQDWSTSFPTPAIPLWPGDFDKKERNKMREYFNKWVDDNLSPVSLGDMSDDKVDEAVRILLDAEDFPLAKGKTETIVKRLFLDVKGEKTRYAARKASKSASVSQPDPSDVGAESKRKRPTESLEAVEEDNGSDDDAHHPRASKAPKGLQ